MAHPPASFHTSALPGDRADAARGRERDASAEAAERTRPRGFAVVEISPGEEPPPGGWIDLVLDGEPADAPMARGGSAPSAPADEVRTARDAARASALAALAAPRRRRLPVQLLLVAIGFAALATAEIAYVVLAMPRAASGPPLAVAHGARPAPATIARGERRGRRATVSGSARGAPLAPAATATPQLRGACPAPQEPSVERAREASAVAPAEGAAERVETAWIRPADALAALESAPPPPPAPPAAHAVPASGAPPVVPAAGAPVHEGPPDVAESRPEEPVAAADGMSTAAR